MILVDTALERRHREGRPIRVGLIGAGAMGRGIAHQLLTPLPGIHLAVLANRSLERAVAALREANIDDPPVVETVSELEDAVSANRTAVTAGTDLVSRAENIDVIVECTGQVEFGARLALSAIEHGKHLVLVNAELDATVGPILKVRAERAGVVLTNTDGDEPGVAMNLLRFVKTIGYSPVMVGNIKGFYDPYRNPETQREFADRVGQDVRMVTSFADGTKLSMETAILANATGYRVGCRGMHGPRCRHVKNIVEHFQPEDIPYPGMVDFVLGAEPGTGAFVVGRNDSTIKREYMRYFKMGDGPLHVFYTPFHLPHLQVAITVARAALFEDAAVTPIGPPICEVITMAKRDLRRGERLDGIGGFTCYGLIDNVDECAAQALLPMGVAEGCRLRRDVGRDEVIGYRDVELPEGRLVDALRLEQDEVFKTSSLASASVTSGP